MQPIEEFYLSRIEDESGVSGVGIVARGVVLPSGHCVLEWLTFTSSITIFRSMTDLIEVHGHGGKTQVVKGTPKSNDKRKKQSKGN